MSIASHLLRRAVNPVAHRNLTTRERKVAVQLVSEGKLIARKDSQFTYYYLPK